MSVETKTTNTINPIVNTVSEQDVMAILNGKTTKVKDLQAGYKLGAMGYQIDKAFQMIKSFVMRTTTKTLEKMQNAENIDRLPEAIKLTAAKIQNIMDKGNYMPGYINQTMLLLDSHKTELSSATNRQIQDSKDLQKGIKDLCRYSAKLANLHGSGSTLDAANKSNMGSWTKALASLVQNHKDTLLKEGFLPLYFVAEAAEQFAKQAKGEKIVELAKNFDTFVKAATTSLGLNEKTVKTHAYKALSSITFQQDFFSADNESKTIAAQSTKSRKEIKDIESEIANLRGPTGNDGQIHKNWLAYIRANLQVILEEDALKYRDRNARDNPNRIINDAELRNINELLHKDENALHNEESFCLEIMSRKGFASNNHNYLQNQPHADVKLLKKAMEKRDEAKKLFDTNLKRLHDLAGDHCMGLTNKNVPCELTRLQRSIEDQTAEVQKKFAEGRELSESFFKRLNKATEDFKKIDNAASEIINEAFAKVVASIENVE